MKFDDMQKIWNCQQGKLPYDINEEVLHRRIKSTKECETRRVNMDDLGLVFIYAITAIIYSFINWPLRTYDYLIVGVCIVIVGWIWISRLRRIKKERAFAQTMLGELNHAIFNVKYSINRIKRMLQWVTPLLAISVFSLMLHQSGSIWKWVGIAIAFVLSALLLNRSYSKRFKPKLRELKTLRNKLTQNN